MRTLEESELDHSSYLGQPEQGEHPTAVASVAPLANSSSGR